MRRRPYGGVIGALNLPTTSVASGCWSLTEAAKFSRSSGYPLVSWPSLKDANFSTVVGLFHFEHMDGRVGMYDSSGSHVNAFPFASVNDVSGMTNATTPKFGDYCFFVSSSGSNGPGVKATHATNYAFGTGDFTMECFFLQFSFSGSSLQILLDTRSGSSSQVAPTLYINASDKLIFFQNGVDRITGTTSVTQNVWHHVAASRVSGSTRLYLDGVQEGSTYTDANSYNGIVFVIGSGPIPSSPLRGVMDEVRVNNGHGYYSGASLTVPTASFPDY